MHRLVVMSVTTVLSVWLAAKHCKPLPKATDEKLILSWVPFFGSETFHFGDGSPQAFKNAGCPYTKCRILYDRRYVPVDDYDAVLFHGFEYFEAIFGVPNARSPKQIYVFMSLESAMNTAIPERFEGFYNLTMTYRLDSDIVWPYFAFVDKMSGEDVAPADNPNWSDVKLDDDPEEASEIRAMVKSKDKLVAWFVSNCNSGSGREKYAQDLNEMGAKVDIYGKCGTLKCPVSSWGDCLKIITKYHFYLAFENSLCVDYVTEKPLSALFSGAVPVVLHGSNLTKFLPPGSYVDARGQSPASIAGMLRWYAQHPDAYIKFFDWRTRYRIEKRNPSFVWPKGKHPMCKLCTLLHEERELPKREVRSWWHTQVDGGPACFDPS